MEINYPIRVNKYLAQQGYATRKDGDRLVEAGLVIVNGAPAVIGQKIEKQDMVEVRYQPRDFRYVAYHKPIGVVTHSPQYGEKDAAGSVGIAGLFPVGRLDKRSHGLLILTDDARVTDRLLSPRYEHEKEYLVKTIEELPSHFKMHMESGVDIGGYTTKKCVVEVHGPRTFLIRLTEGKKHQIRRMCAELRLTIDELERTKVTNIKLARLKPGERREIKGDELAKFLTGLGL